jgi:hypothetical protein
MEIPANPNEALAAKTLPKPLRQAIQATFGGGLIGCALVGGTALAGYYAGHRESDDMDLFTADVVAQAMTVAAVKSLAGIGVVFSDERNSPSYYHVLASLGGHSFSIDVVLDANIHRIGAFLKTSDGVQLANLETLLMMKIATLVGRCSEKDLFDLKWLTEHYRNPDVKEWIALGQKVDGGANAESMLISLSGANLRIEGCGFAAKFGVSSGEVLKMIMAFRSTLQKKLVAHLEAFPPSTNITALLREIRRLK